MTISTRTDVDITRSSSSDGAERGGSHPVIPGFYPDPTVCRVGDDYYLANSSFEYFPGAPIFHSRNLVDWTQIGHVLDRRSQFRLGVDLPSTGIYGSTLRHHDGRFWFITTNVSDFESGQLIVTAEDPSGPWSDPVFVPEATGIDPDLCWDDDGTCYLTWNALDFATGGRGIRQARINPVTGQLLESDYPVWQGTGLLAPEGPHLYHVGAYWYLLLAEGGTERGHCVTVARGPRPSGPFEPCPWNPVFTHRSTGHPVQNVGHADLVEAPDGGWAAVYLGARPDGPTPGFHVLGRETFLAGVDWVDGWPAIDEDRFPRSAVDTGFVDDLTNPVLSQRWVTTGAQPEDIVSRTPNGSVVAFGALLCTRVRDLRWSSTAEFEGSGRLRLLIDDRHWYEVAFADRVVTVVRCIGGIEEVVASVSAGARSLVLLISAVDPLGGRLPFGHAGPDDIVLAFRELDEETELARLDGRYLSTEVAGGFTGRMLGVGSSDDSSLLRSVTYRAAGPM